MEKFKQKTITTIFIMLIIIKGVLIYYQVENSDNNLTLAMLRETINLMTMVTLFGLVLMKKS